MRVACAVLLCAMSLASCSRATPTSPTPPATPPVVVSPPVNTLRDFSGTWSGTSKVTKCDGIMSDPRTCGSMMLATFLMTVRLTQEGQQVQGVLVMSDTEIPLRGVVTDGGILMLSGIRSQEAAGLEPIQISNWSSTLNGDGTLQSGVFSRVTPGKTTVGPPQALILYTDNQFTGLSRMP